jgi:hypothetical protein
MGKKVCLSGKHVPSVSAKEQRMYEHIKESAEKEGVRANAPRK